MTRQMVAPPDHVRPNHSRVPSVHLNLNVRGLSTSAALGVNERSAALIRDGREVFKLGLGQSPFPVPEPVVEALRQNACRRDYLPVRGLAALREAVAGYPSPPRHRPPRPVVEALRQNACRRDYLPVRGLAALREAVAGYHHHRHGISDRRRTY